MRLEEFSQALSHYANYRLSKTFINEFKDKMLFISSRISHLHLRELHEQIASLEIINIDYKIFKTEDDNEEILDFGHHGSVVIDKDNEHLYPKRKKINKKSKK